MTYGKKMSVQKDPQDDAMASLMSDDGGEPEALEGPGDDDEGDMPIAAKAAKPAMPKEDPGVVVANIQAELDKLSQLLS